MSGRCSRCGEWHGALVRVDAFGYGVRSRFCPGCADYLRAIMDTIHNARASARGEAEGGAR